MPAFFKALSLGFCLVPLAAAYKYSIDVGKNDTNGQKGIGFDPTQVSPSPGDIVIFVFQSGTHSVDQSTFDHPCTPNGNFDSGAKTIPDDTALDAPGLPIVEIYIKDTTPQWFFDQASGECQQGAVFAINPTTNQNFTAFLANAAKDTPPATASSGFATGTSTSTGSNSRKTNAAMKHDMAFGGVALLLLVSVVVFLGPC
ncbi:hypothetical protein APHAL10511_007528 [Amanita phalloides]|nr:hypothetical protein APHAL10511_007528 [Amanita phalloides]